ncbi:G-protein coupled receptor 54-like [Antedon mediterranea]|uniref:G-protein coupled receptor 54-like n=1 Tax=Antedon mediterranea TaxID=105859 RepID=UPI003AF8A1FA
MDDNATFPAAGINDYDISYGNDYYDIVNMLDVEQIAIPFTWTLFIVVGLGCNSLIIYVVCRFGTMRTVTNCYIVNISVTDIMFLSSVEHSTDEEQYRRMLCHPMSVSSLLSIPISIFSTVMDFNGRHYCVEEFNEQGLLAHYIYVVFSTYIIPLSVLVVCNVNMLRQLWKTREQLRDTTLSLHSIQQRKKVTKMILLVVVFFFICWLPIHVINLWQRLGNSINNNLAISKLRIFALTLAYSNSCVNPFVYAFMGENFRACFRRAFPMCTKVNRVRNSSMLLNNNRTRETQVQKDTV